MARTKRGDGSVFQRKDGKWEGRIVVGYNDSGNAKTRSVTAKTKTECKQKLAKLREECGRRSENIKPDMLFGDWIDFWYQNFSKPKLRKSTQSCYEGRIYTHIIPNLGKFPLNKLSQNDLQQFYANLKKNGRKIHTDIYGTGLSDRMVKSIHTACRTSLEKAVSEGLIKNNPAVGCKLPPKRGMEMQVLSQPEITRFLMQAKEEGYYEMFLLEFLCGLRRGELLGLKWQDLNFRTGELHISRQVMKVAGQRIISEPKTKSSIRTLIIPHDMAEMLLNLQKNVDSEWIFPSPVNQAEPRNPSAVYHRFKLILERAQCKNIRFHDLRHTFSTMMLEHGTDIRTLSAMLGHSNVDTALNTYLHVSQHMEEEAAVKIDRAIGGTDAQLSDVASNRNAEESKDIKFEPYKGKIRKPGTGCIYQINEHLWEGSYYPKMPGGKRKKHNIYAHSYEECEEKLTEMIEKIKEEIRQIKEKEGFEK